MWQAIGVKKKVKKKKKGGGHTFHIQSDLSTTAGGREPVGGGITEHSSCRSFALCLNHQEKEEADWTPRQ